MSADAALFCGDNTSADDHGRVLVEGQGVAASDPVSPTENRRSRLFREGPETASAALSGGLTTVGQGKLTAPLASVVRCCRGAASRGDGSSGRWPRPPLLPVVPAVAEGRPPERRDVVMARRSLDLVILSSGSSPRDREWAMRKSADACGPKSPSCVPSRGASPSSSL